MEDERKRRQLGRGHAAGEIAQVTVDDKDTTLGKFGGS